MADKYENDLPVENTLDDSHYVRVVGGNSDKSGRCTVPVLAEACRVVLEVPSDDELTALEEALDL